MPDSNPNELFELKSLDPEDQALCVMDILLAEGYSMQAALGSTVERYPAQAALLSDFAISTLSSGAVDHEENAALEGLIDEIASTVADRLAADPPMVGEFSSILSRINDLKLDLQVFCRELRVGRSILVKLDRRLIDLTSLPERFLSQLSGRLEVSVEALANFLSAAPRLSPVAEFKATDKPMVSRKEQFLRSLEAALASGEISEADADHWREMGDSKR